MDLPMFRSMLLMHKDTLKTIDIGSLSSSGRGRLLDVSDFPNLEVLKLSRWQMEKNLEFSSTQADLLLAPNLKTFGWSFSIYDQHNESWTDFGDREERWVREFAKAATARKAMLKMIKITFDPDEWESREEDGYPWDRMDRIRDELRPCGIALEHSEPQISKEAWLEQWCPLPEEARTLPEEACSLPEEERSLPVFERGGIREYFSPIRR